MVNKPSEEHGGSRYPPPEKSRVLLLEKIFNGGEKSESNRGPNQKNSFLRAEENR
mgnify:CR=1 FL=1